MKRVVILLLFLCSSAFPQSAWAESYEISVEASIIPTDTSPRSLARGPDGKLHAVYHKPHSSYYAYSTDEGATWTEEALPNSHLSSLAIDTMGQVHIVWSHIDGNHVYYVKRTAAGWQSQEEVSGPSDNDSIPLIALDSQNNVHVVWGADSYTAYRKRTSLGWQPEETVAAPNAGGTSLAIDSADNIHVAYRQSPYVYYRKRTAAGWQPPETIDVYSSNISLAIDAADDVHAAWVSGTWSDGIRYRKRTNEGWQPIETVVSMYLRSHSLAVDAQRNVHVVWCTGSPFPGTTSTFWHRKRTSIGWQPQTVLTTGGYDPLVTSLWAFHPSTAQVPQTGFAFMHSSGHKVIYYRSSDLVWRITDTTPPATPVGVNDAPSDGQVQLAWQANTESDLSGYNIYRSLAEDGAYAKQNSLLLTTTTFTQTGLANGTTYWYKVSSVDASNNESPLSQAVSARPLDSTLPAVPLSLIAVSGDAQVQLTWQANAEPDLRGYNVYRSLSENGVYGKQTSALLSTALFTQTALLYGTTYWYKVSAVDTSDNESALSTTAHARPENTNPPAIPAGLTGKAKNKQALLKWQPNAEADLAGYRVYRADSEGGPFVLQTPALWTTTRFKQNHLTNGRPYWYAAGAVDTAGNESARTPPIKLIPNPNGVPFRIGFEGYKMDPHGKIFAPTGNWSIHIVMTPIDHEEEDLWDLPDEIKISLDGVVCKQPPPSRMPQSIPVSLENLSEGAHTLSVEVFRDEDGVIQENHMTRPIFLKKTRPKPPIIVIEEPRTPKDQSIPKLIDTNPAGEVVTYEWTFTPIRSSRKAEKVSSLTTASSYSSPAQTPAAVRVASADTPTMTTADLPAGLYQVSVVAIDGAGNRSDPALSEIQILAPTLAGVNVYPNPWRADLHRGRDVTFDQLTSDSQVRLFTVAGHWLKTLTAANGAAAWNLTNDNGETVASGIYLYLITDGQGGKARGQVVVIR